jgi:hypothetical protein
LLARRTRNLVEHARRVISEINELATRSAHSPNGLPGPCWPFEGRRPATTAEKYYALLARRRSRISGASRKPWGRCCPPR